MTGKLYLVVKQSLLLYTCCYTHKERLVLILERATNHLLWSYPGYQVNSGQNKNRKAQCQVEMAQKREGGGGAK